MTCSHSVIARFARKIFKSLDCHALPKPRARNDGKGLLAALDHEGN